MASKDQLQRDLVRYEQLKNKLSVCSSSLASASASVNKAKNTMDIHYTIDENSSNIALKTSNLGINIIETSNYVKNVIIPAIVQRQQEIKAEIGRIEAEERRRAEEVARAAEEARRAEEEARRAREQAAAKKTSYNKKYR